MTDSTRRPRPKLMTACPYCGSPQEEDKLHTRFYGCRTTGNRDTGDYMKRCKGS